MSKIQRVHFIGIGGSGMSGIALVAHELGMKVSGSDLKETRYMRALLRAGVPVSVGHDAANVADPQIDVVVVSTAIPKQNPEYLAAEERGLKIWPRARMLAYLSQGYLNLAVAGTHGKTTTSSMLATALDRLGAQPTFLVGGVVDGHDSNAHCGSGKYFVVEADESDGSFTWLDPDLAILTNVEVDHVDHYGGLDEILGSFESFTHKVNEQGVLVVWAGSPELTDIAERSGRRVLSYGLESTADVRLRVLDTKRFAVEFMDGQSVELGLQKSPGVHNMLNATAVMCALDALGFERQASADAISGFTGVRRRFDQIGEAAGVVVIDDYGHHPTEIDATLKAASELGYNKVHVLFQPHRYSRTEALLSDFATAFDHADTVTLMDVYSAGEAPIPGVNSQTLLEAIQTARPDTYARFIKHRQDTAASMASVADAGDMVITMGAGDITLLAPVILEQLKERETFDQQAVTERPTVAPHAQQTQAGS